MHQHQPADTLSAKALSRLAEGIRILDIPPQPEFLPCGIAVCGAETLFRLCSGYLEEIALFNRTLGLVASDCTTAEGRTEVVVRHILDSLAPWRMLAAELAARAPGRDFSADPLSLGDAGSGGGIGWALIDDITNAEVKEEKIIDCRYYHTIKEVKNGEGPHPIKTPKGWLHLAHGVRGCASGLRYVLYMYMTALDEPWREIATPGGYFMAPVGEEYIGDVMNVLFTNGWIADEDGTVYIYYASSDTRMHVATSTIDRLVDYCMNTPADGLSTSESVKTLNRLIDKNLKIMGR